MRVVRPILVTLLFAAFWMALATSFVFAQNVRIMSDEEAARFDARLRNWATTYYPAMVTDERLPDGVFFAFLVDDKDAVVRHTAAFQNLRDGVRLSDELARVFPGVDASALSSAGGECFLPKPGQPRKYCVYFALFPK